MPDLEKYIYEKVKHIISKWDEDDIYAVSFFVESNEAIEYNGYSNVTCFAVSYNTESYLDGAGELDEERWNYAYWQQDEYPIIDPYEGSESAKLLFDWYNENNIRNIGFEDYDCYDANGCYIGKGPVGHYELLTIASKVANRLQKEEFLKSKFGRSVPIIVHGLEYAWYDIEATKFANPNGEAETFFRAMKQLGFIY